MTILVRGTLRENIWTQTLATIVLKFLCPRRPHSESGVRRALCRLPQPTPARPSRGDRARRPLPSPPRPARDSLLGRTPHRRPRLPTGRCLPALRRRGSGHARRRGPRLRSRLLHTALVRPRSRMGHSPPTHGAAGGGAAGVQPPPSDAAPLPSGRTAVAAAAPLPAGFRGSTGRFRERHRRPPSGL